MRLRMSWLPQLALFAIVSAASAQVPSGPGDWPQWRGPNRDNVSRETGLLKAWPAEGPQVAWQVDSVGAGYSSMAVKDGLLLTQGDLDGVEHVICLSVNDGSTVWAVQPEPAAKALAERVAKEFEQADKDGDGKIVEAEGLASFGWRNFNSADSAEDGDAERIASERAGRLLAALDENKDGKLTYPETDNRLRDVYYDFDQPDEDADEAKLAKQRIDGLLALLDENEDGRISRDESRRSELDREFNRIDKRDPATNKGDQELTTAELQEYFTRFEPGEDGELTRAELESYYARTLPGQDGVLTEKDLQQLYGGLRDGRGDGPRGTPTIDGNRVYAEGGMGNVTCLDLKSGKTIWHVHLREDLGGGRPGWGYSESPLVFDDYVVVTPGGREGTLAALDKHTGEVVWRSSDVTQGAHYSSPVLAEIGGQRQIVQFARENCFGVTADGGKLLWSFDDANNGTANCATAIVDQDHVFASSAYGTGGGLARIKKAGEGFEAELVYFEKKMANHHGGIVKVGDYMYGFGSGGLICMDYLTGEIAWTDRSVGKGSLIYADGMLYCLSERHQVALVEAYPKEYREHGRFSIEEQGRPSWAHPIVAGGKFFIRDQQRLTAYDVSAK